MQVKCEPHKRNAWTETFSGHPRALAYRRVLLTAGTSKSWVRTAPPEGSSAGTAPKSWEEVSDPDILHSAVLIFLHLVLNPWKGYGLNAQWYQKRDKDVRTPPNDRQAGKSSPHGVWDLRGGKHGQLPGGPVLFQRRAQDQSSFGIGIVCGQCHKGLILIQRERKKTTLIIISYLEKPTPGPFSTTNLAKLAPLRSICSINKGAASLGVEEEPKCPL